MEESLLATCAYIDLHAGGRRHRQERPRPAPHTSIKATSRARPGAGAEPRTLERRPAQAASPGSNAPRRAWRRRCWLCPVRGTAAASIQRAEGMLEGFSLGSYLLLVDYTGRVVPRGQRPWSLRELAAIFERLGTTAETWQAQLQRLVGPAAGRFFAASRQRLREVGERVACVASSTWAAAPAS